MRLRKETIFRALFAFAYLYTFGIISWYLLKLIYGDEWWWLSLLNTCAVYVFLPLPAVFLWAFLRKHRGVLIGCSSNLLLAIYLYGGLFWPQISDVPPSTTQLTIMTWNVLWHNTHVDNIIATIQAERADVIGLQELSPSLAEALHRQLITEYPYQMLKPQKGVGGLGIISRHPLKQTEITLSESWIGTPPQVLTMTVHAIPVTLIHFHAMAIIPWSRNEIEYSARKRVKQAQMIRDVARASPHPVVAFGDLNATDQSGAYAQLTPTLTDAWREAGWGLGHTFSCIQFFRSSRRKIIGIFLPRWVARIDYIFSSHHWHAVQSRMGSWDGYSDHRPVVVTLAYREYSEQLNH